MEINFLNGGKLVKGYSQFILKKWGSRVELHFIFTLYCSKIKIIAQTAYASQEDKQRSIDGGCVDYISIPLKRDHLLAMINKHLCSKI